MSTQQEEKRMMTQEEVRNLLDAFNKEEQKARQDINLPFDNPARITFNMIVDTMKMFTRLTKSKGPTKIYLPKSLEILLDMYLKRQLEDDNHKGLRNSKKFLGCDMIFDAPEFKFE